VAGIPAALGVRRQHSDGQAHLPHDTGGLNMAQTINSARLRLICHEIVAKVNARRGREEATEEAVLFELLRRVESHLGRRPAALSAGAGSTSAILAALSAMVRADASASLDSILDTELLGKVALGGSAKERLASATAARGDGARGRTDPLRGPAPEG
jgi:hypothetical protein